MMGKIPHQLHIKIRTVVSILWALLELLLEVVVLLGAVGVPGRQRQLHPGPDHGGHGLSGQDGEIGKGGVHVGQGQGVPLAGEADGAFAHGQHALDGVAGGGLQLGLATTERGERVRISNQLPCVE